MRIITFRALNSSSYFSLIASVLIIVNMTTITHAETVNVKYRGSVDVSSYNCNSVTRSSFIRRVCFNQSKQHMIIKLKGTYYEYYRVDDGTVNNLLNAPSMGRHYNSSTKSDAASCRFDCN
jgi:hypothetical protein